MRTIILAVGLILIGWAVVRQLVHQVNREDYIPITPERRQMFVAAEIHAHEQ